MSVVAQHRWQIESLPCIFSCRESLLCKFSTPSSAASICLFSLLNLQNLRTVLNYITEPSHWSIVLTDLFGICCTIAVCFKLSIGAVFVDAASRSHKNDGSELDFVCDDTCTGSRTLLHLSPLRFQLTDHLPQTVTLLQRLRSTSNNSSYHRSTRRPLVAGTLSGISV